MSKKGEEEGETVQALLCLLVTFLHITEFGSAGFAPLSPSDQSMACSATLSVLTDTTDHWYFPLPARSRGTGGPSVSASSALWTQ